MTLPSAPPGCWAGIDVSHYQAAIDWELVAQSGVRTAYCKASEGVTVLDSRYYSYMNDARGAGLKVGPYHFYRPQVDPERQAEWFLHCAGVNPDWLPHALDIEVRERETTADFVRGITLFLEIVGAAIKRPAALYFSPSFWMELGNPKDFKAHPLWLADYGVSSPPEIGGWGPDGWSIWQYASNGKIPGITGDVDVNWVKPGPWCGESS